MGDTERLSVTFSHALTDPSWIHIIPLIQLIQYRIGKKREWVKMLVPKFQVMSQKHNRNMSFSMYICVLAVSDTVSLTIGKIFKKFFFFAKHQSFLESQQALFWTSSDVYPGFQSQSGYPCMLRCLHALDSSDSTPICRLLSSWQSAWRLSNFNTCTSIGGAPFQDGVHHCLTACDKIDTLLVFSRFRLGFSFQKIKIPVF